MTATVFGWLFTLGVLAHNAEEALYLPGWSQSAAHGKFKVGVNEFRFAVGVHSLALRCAETFSRARSARIL